MELNNRCNCLIAFGTFAPGGKNHAVFSNLPGEWKKGKILARRGEHADDICNGETDVIEAWMIEFSDCDPEMFTDEEKARERLLFDRWTALDEAMGPDWGRDQWRWWPEHSDHFVRGPGSDMKVLNIYVPLARFPSLANQFDPIAPDDEENFAKLWRQLKTGEKNYDFFDFGYLFDYVPPSEVREYFGDLPKGDLFIARLNELYDPDALQPNICYGDQLNALRVNEKSLEEAVEILRRHLEQQADILRWGGYDKEADILARVPVEQGIECTKDEDHDCSSEEFGAWELSFDMVTSEQQPSGDDDWFYGLQEACGFLTRHRFMPYWLIRDWLDLPVDLEPIKELFLAGYWYQINGDTCFVFKARYGWPKV